MFLQAIKTHCILYEIIGNNKGIFPKKHNGKPQYTLEGVLYFLCKYNVLLLRLSSLFHFRGRRKISSTDVYPFQRSILPSIILFDWRISISIWYKLTKLCGGFLLGHGKRLSISIGNELLHQFTNVRRTFVSCLTGQRSQIT